MRPSAARPLTSKLPHVGTTIFSVMSQLAHEHGAINLGQGFPDFAAPEPLIDALTRAAREGMNQYAAMAGLPALREAIATKTRECYGREVDPALEVTVTSGATEALFDAVHAVVRAGDEVIVLDPSYDSYAPAVALAGGVTVRVPLDSRDFAVDWGRVTDAITPRTRAIIGNSPHNPTGAIWSAADLAVLSEITDRHDLLLISDEVYEHITYDGQPHQSALRHPNLANRTFVVSSFGKTYHCTGWKVGYCIAPEALTEEFRKIHQYNTFATFTPAQSAFATMLSNHPRHHEELGSFYQRKRDRFRSQLARTRLRPLPVAGGFFQLVDYSAVSDLPDVDFARWLCVSHGVAAIPLSPFYGTPPTDQRLVRLCFAKHDDTLDAALGRLEAL